MQVEAKEVTETMQCQVGTFIIIIIINIATIREGLTVKISLYFHLKRKRER